MVGIDLNLWQLNAGKNGAQKLLATFNDSQGLAIDFATDQSMVVADQTTQANNYSAAGIVNADGTLAGPGGKLAYSANSPSPKFCLQSNGNLAFGPHNLYLNSSVPATQTVTVLSGQQYIVTVVGSGSLTLSNAASGSVTSSAPTIFTASSTTLVSTLVGSLSTIQLSSYPAVNSYVKTAGTTQFALPYEYNTSGACQGMLVEQQGTNLLLRSNTFGTTWTNTNITNLTNTTTGPDGLATSATLLNETVTNGVHSVQQTVTKAASALAYTYTVYAKQGVGRTRIALQMDDASGNGAVAVYDLAGGAVGVAAAGVGTPFTALGASIIALPNGWYRCVLNATSNTATSIQCTSFDDSGSGSGAISNSYVGTVGNGVYIYGAQLEQFAYQTSYINTAASTVTRLQDVISIANSLYPSLLPNAGIYYKGVLQYVVGGSEYGFYTATNSTDRYILYNSGGTPTFFIESGNVTQGVLQPGGAFTINTPAKIAAAGAPADFATVFNNGTPNVQASGSIPVTLTTTYIGGASGNWPGYLQQVLLIPRRWSNTQMRTITT